MGRPGITYHDVANAASKIQLSGKSPTIESVRAVIGSGSSSTISNHLRSWKEKSAVDRSIGDNLQLPDDVITVIENLWDVLQSKSQESVISMKKQHDEKTSEMINERNALANEVKDQSELNNNLAVKNSTLLDQIKELDQEIISLKNELSNTKNDNSKLISEKNAHEDRINDLINTNMQIQQNLDHYRDAMRTQREQDRVQFEDAINEKINLINHLELRINTLSSTHNDIDKSNAVLKSNNETLLAQLKELNAKVEFQKTNILDLKNKCLLLETANDKLTEINHKTEKMLQENEEAASNFIKHNSAQAATIALLNEEQEKLTNQIDQLESDKWSIGQEKAVIHSQLKLLQEAV